MLDKFITHTVCWYKTLYQVLPVAWTNRITTRSDTGSHNRLNPIQSLVPTHYVYVCNGYVHFRTSTFFSFYLELYKNKFKNLVQTGKLKFSFREMFTANARQWGKDSRKV